MKRLILLSIFAFVFSFTVGLITTNVNAEESKFTITSYLTKMEFTPVADVEKHVLGTYERRGVTIFDNGEITTYYTIGTYDFVDSVGPFKGYTILTYNDGSTAISKYDAIMTKEAGKMPKLKGKGEYIKGTGKYEGIKGTLSFTGEYITPYNKETKGDMIVYGSSNYTISK